MRPWPPAGDPEAPPRSPVLVLGALLLVGAAAVGGAGGASPVDPATLEMAALLQQRAAAVDPMKLPFVVNDLRAAYLGEALSWPRPSAERLPLRASYALELVQSGQLAESLRQMDELERDARAHDPARWARFGPQIRMLRASAYLRLAETQNCHQQNNRDSCLLPIRGAGVHRAREGATRAIEVLRGLLEEDRGNLAARWLLNVASMTLGTYPEGVGESQLVPPAAFAAEHALPRFENVAHEAGLDVYGLSGGALLDDFDGNGSLDLVVSHLGFKDQLRFFRNRGNGRFEERTSEAGLTGVVGGLNMIHADYDNDGFPDILVLRGGWLGSEGRFPFSLLRNRGDGTFADVTKAAGLLSHLAPTQAAVFFDQDGDGRLDLFVGNESGPGPEPLFPCELFRNNGDGTFTNVAREAGVDVVGLVKGVAAGDYDDDGRPDLYLSLKEGENRLLRNEGPGPEGTVRFRDVARAAGVSEPHKSFGTFFFDYDNDGRLDLFVAGFGAATTMAADTAADYLGLPHQGERGRLYRNRGDGTFEDVTRPAGLYRFLPAMGLNFGDLDNDGWLDIYLGTGDPDLTALIPNRMFRNAEGRSFQDVTTAGNFGHLQKGHAIAFGDVDGDGDQDVFAQMGGAFADDKAFSTLYRNPGPANRWVVLELEGVRSNRSALGARIKVTVDTPRGPRVLHRAVTSGGSFGGSPFRQHIGLGDARRVASVEIFWPATGATQRLPGLAMGRRHAVREGGPAPDH